MAETSFRATVRTARSTRHALLTLVREACDMLVFAHPTVVGSITVSRTLDDGDGAALVRTMAVRLAEEYGLDAEARVKGRTIVVRLSRPASNPVGGQVG
jgi:hypothetical protein